MRRYFLLTLLTTSPMFAQLPSGVQWTQQIVNSNPAFPWDQAKTIAIDPAGNIYVAGVTYSSGLPVTSGVVQAAFAGHDKACQDRLLVPIPCSDAFVAKYDSQGGLIFLTYFGGSRDEILDSLAADASGVYISGLTGSADFPVTANTFGVAPPSSGYANFVTKLSADGSSILYSALVNLNSNAFIAVGANSTFYVATIQGAQVTAETCSIQHVDPATKMVVGSTSFPSSCSALATGPDGSVYIAGQTSGGFAATSGAWLTKPVGGVDYFVAKLNASLSTVQWATYVGGSGDEYGVPYLAVNANSEVFLASSTQSNDFPTTAGVWQPSAPGNCTSGANCGYLVRLSADGSRALYATNLMGRPTAIAAEANGQVVLSGFASPFLIRAGGPWPCLQTVSSTLLNNWILRFDASGNPSFATWSGPSVPVAGIAMPSPDHLLVTGEIALPQATYSGREIVNRSIPPFNGAYPILSMLSTIPGPLQLLGTCVQQSGSPYSRAIVLPGENVSGQAGVAPGEVISIYGTGIGPTQGVQIPARSLSYPSSIAGVQVFFDDIAAPLMYASSNQINAVAPFELAGKAATTVRVEGAGAVTNSVSLPMAASAPEILFLANADATQNSASNPAHMGDEIAIYASGAGAMTPATADGFVPTSATRHIAQPVSISLTPFVIAPVAGLLPGTPVPATILYRGEAPLQISGMVQINFSVPSFTNVAGAVVIQLAIGNALGSATLFVQ